MIKLKPYHGIVHTGELAPRVNQGQIWAPYGVCDDYKMRYTVGAYLTKEIVIVVVTVVGDRNDIREFFFARDGEDMDWVQIEPDDPRVETAKAVLEIAALIK